MIGRSIGLVAVRVLGMVFALAFFLALARLVSMDTLGQISSAISASLILGLALTANYGAGAVRYLPELINGQPAMARQYIRTGRRLWLRCSAIALLLAIALGAAAGFGIDVPLYWIAAFMLAPLLAWMRLNAAYVAALGGVVRGAVPNTLLRPAFMLAGLVALWVASTSIDVQTALTLYGCALLATVCIQHFLFQPSLAQVKSAQETNTPNRQWLGTGLSLVIPVLFLELIVDIVVVLASFVLTDAQVGAVAVIMRLQALILFGVTSVNMVVSPRISKAHAAGQTGVVSRLLVQSAHLKFWPSVAAYIALWFLAEPVLGIFGEDYRVFTTELMLIATTPLIMAAFGPLVLLVTVLGLEQPARRVFAEALAILVVASLALGAYLGPIGLVLSVVLVWLYWHARLALIVLEASTYPVSFLTRA